jgi:4-amino-4-deoxy-L-arabinose transferase-like glycosyltransferase
LSARVHLRPADVGRLILVLAGSLPLLFFDFGRRFLATNDETRFPLLARDILAHGHWLLPQLNGVPHLNKPPLYAWLIALTSWPTGAVTQRNAALASLLAALAVVLGTYWIASRLFGRRVATLAGLIAVTTAGVFTQARIPMPDMALCAAFTAAMAAYVAAEFEGRRTWLILFYAAVGAAFWLKGPAGLLPLAVVITDTLAAHGWQGPARLGSVPGLALLGLLLAPWPFLAAAAGGARFVHTVVVNDLLLWYVPLRGWSWRLMTEPFGQAFTILLPWSLILPAALWTTTRTADPDRGRRLRLLLLWLVVMFAFLAVSAQQRFRYYLPLCPPVALLLAAWYSRLPLKRPAVVFASVWMLVAGGLSIGQAYTAAWHNAGSSLRVSTSQMQQAPAALYAVDVPELVFTFYLDRPVTLLPSYTDFERAVPAGRDAYLLIAPGAVPPASTAVREIGTDRLNRRPISIIRAAPVS